MSVLLTLSRLIDRVNERIGKIAGYAILLAILVSAGNAVIRKVAPRLSSNAWLEMQWYLFGAAFLLCAGLVLRQNEHIRIDILYAALSRRAQHWIDLLGHLLFLAPFCLLMLYHLGPYALKSFRSGEMSTNAGGLIIWPAKSLLLIGFTLLTLQCLSEIIKKIAVMRGVIEDPTPFVSSHDSAKAEAEALIEEIKQ
ncbi:TRAP transporter small permease subunit [Xinfangfangia sp. CPCC 101601]|uniref:TRAP transporter small permease protein n=1 Tax=Pseudogemmobacter lacusdianii TaxID=3069608 RepID=A0ABU0W1Y1_9RHOB|nr:TRAP transporter small permease subunit [Xinfangfangia sp. CPCC 101601]MDQ2067986.1 TRAP transporter small permease subunit [Xinfangfangia sp. CPCC 101601]